MTPGGLVNNQSFDELLRVLSHRRAQGSLLVEQPPRRLIIRFLAGRIIDAFVENEPRALGSSIASHGDSAWSIDDWYARLNDTEERALLIQAHREQMIDALVLLDLNSATRATFSQHMVRLLAADAPSLSVASILLERQAYLSDRARFAEIFASGQGRIKRSDEPLESSSTDTDEGRVLALVPGEGIPIDELRVAAGLGRVRFQGVLLSLWEQGALEPVTKQTVDEPSATVAAESIKILDAPPLVSERHPQSDAVSPPHHCIGVVTENDITVRLMVAGVAVLAALTLPYVLWRDIVEMFGG